MEPQNPSSLSFLCFFSRRTLPYQHYYAFKSLNFSLIFILALTNSVLEVCPVITLFFPGLSTPSLTQADPIRKSLRTGSLEATPTHPPTNYLSALEGIPLQHKMNHSNNTDLLGVGAQFDPNQYSVMMTVSMTNHQIGYVYRQYSSFDHNTRRLTLEMKIV
jgi:hypothetical protein